VLLNYYPSNPSVFDQRQYHHSNWKNYTLSLHPLGLLELSSSFCENNDSQKPSIPTHYKSSLGLKINDST